MNTLRNAMRIICTSAKKQFYIQDVLQNKLYIMP